MAGKEETPLDDGSKKPQTEGTKKRPTPYDLNSNDRMLHANAAQVTGGHVNKSNAEIGRSEVVGLSNEQWQKLVDMLHVHKTNENGKMTGNNPHDLWIIDSGASNHMTGNLKNLCQQRTIRGCPVGLPNGEFVTSSKEGTVILDGGLKLGNVLYVPNLNCNLISVSQIIDETDCIVQFTKNLCVMQDRTSRMLIGAGERKDGLYLYHGVATARAFQTSTENQLELWHKRMGHASFKVLQLIPTACSSHNSKCLNKVCEICERAKQTKERFTLSTSRASANFDLIHCDLWGPYRTPASCGASYFLTLVDDHSRAVWIYLLCEKREVSQTIMNFSALVERQYNKHIKVIRSDNGTEFTCLKQYFLENGIIHQTSCTGTPQQNGRVERKHRHILNIARALRFQGKLPISFWGECILAAGYLINLTPSPILHGKTPYEMIHGKPPPYDHLRVFGSLCYAHNQGRKGDKFDSRSRKCIFVGYPYGQKGWKLFDLEKQVFFVSRDVKFVETEFPFAEGEGNTQPLDPQVAIVDESIDEEYIVENSPHGDSSLEARGGNAVATDESEICMPPAENQNCTDEVTRTDVDQEVPSPDLPPAPQLGRGHRVKQPSVKLRDYVTNTMRKLSSSDRSSAASHDSGVCYPIAHYVNCDKFSSQHRKFLAAVNVEREPVYFSEAVQDMRWREAMASEIQALQSNGTLTITNLPPGKKALGCKWVYKIKYHSDGTIERFKARLVILGNHQVEGIDYTETFAPVAKMVTVRTILAVAAAKDWELHQMDVHNAFLHGELQEDVYMKLPPGFMVQHQGMVCKLRKSLYGLRQAPRCWFAKLSAALKHYGFRQSCSDYSLFTMQTTNVHLVVLVYVDDLIISGNDSEAIQRFKVYLHTCFHMKHLGRLKYFLGVEVARSPTGIFLCQRKYALDIIMETGLLGAKPACLPLEENHRLALAEGPLFSDPSRYRRLVGRLIYSCFTRLELSYSVHILSQFMQQPKEEHWHAALRVVHYLKGNPGQGILLRRDSDLNLYGWCDSDWAGCPLTRRSLTGWFILLGQSPISWKTKKQHTVSKSSAEAEYRCMANTTCELKWLKDLLSSLGVLHPQPMRLYCDSQAALHIAKNPVFHERTKHIEVDCHFIRDEILKKNICPSYVPTHTQLADIFTKALGTKQFLFLLSKLGIQNLHAPT